MTELADILDGLADHVRLLKELGGRTAELSPEALEALAPPETAATATGKGAPAGRAGAGRAGMGAGPVSAGAGPGRAGMTGAELGRAPGAGMGVGPFASAEPPAGAAPGAAAAGLAGVAAEIAACRACPLRERRTNAVPGAGNPDRPDVMFIGEAPGADEDASGEPFVGAAGQFLTKMIRAMGYSREDVFITNVCKCRPPGNRTPSPDEAAACLPFLKRQIALVRPKTLVLLGSTAIRAVLSASDGAARRQGQWARFEGIPAMPTYHPAYVLRFERFGQTAELRKIKVDIWNALKKVMAFLGKSDPRLEKNKER